ncbi:MAG: hypothetical protein NVS9B4_24430 [Candidatus Acidiferrum sp.]
MRLIRVRRKKEKLNLWSELGLVPRWLYVTLAALFLAAQGIGFFVQLHAFRAGGEIVVPNDLPLASLALAGMITLVSLMVAIFICSTVYVYRDAKRRGMNSFLWTLLVIMLVPAWGFLGHVIYFLMREPLPYNCPQCGHTVGARFNFCPNCKCNLYPSCPECKREVVETDKFCPYCGHELAARKAFEGGL